MTQLDLDAQVVLYADDNNMIFIGGTYEELELKINRSLLKINNWMNNNELTLNSDKSKYMVINISGRQTPNLDI